MGLSPLKSCIKEIEQNAFLCSHFLEISLFQTKYLENILYSVSLGAWHKSAISEVKKLGSAKARQNGEEESVEISRLFQKLSVALMRGNCALFNNRVPSSDAGLMLE